MKGAIGRMIFPLFFKCNLLVLSLLNKTCDARDEMAYVCIHIYAYMCVYVIFYKSNAVFSLNANDPWFRHSSWERSMHPNPKPSLMTQFSPI